MFKRCIFTNSIPFKLTHRSNASLASGYQALTSAKPCKKSLSPFRLAATSSAHYVHVTSRRGIASKSGSPPEVELSDNEWEIRTGRAISVLRETIPNFFSTGIVTSISKSSGAPRIPPSNPLTNLNLLEQNTPQDDDDEPIYSPNVFLHCTTTLRRTPLPTTFRIDGLQFYVALSNAVRHSMSALYSDLSVVLLRVVVDPCRDKDVKTRQKSVVVILSVTGVGRVSRKPTEWEVHSVYTFSPITGLIQEHFIDSILPEPHEAMYESVGMTPFPPLGGYHAT